jgi:histone acetyltransferase HTATIP
MPPLSSTLPDDHASLTWPIHPFILNHSFRSPSPAYLLLNRATSEFGIFYSLAAGTVIMAQHPDNEPVYFAVSSTRAACSRPGQTCKKVYVLVHEAQLDLEFGTADAAADFSQALGRLATKVGNMGFEVFEAQSYVSVSLTFESEMR